MRTLSSVLIAVSMCIFGLGVFYEQVFAWPHLKVITVVGAALLSMGVCILYDKYLKERP